MKPLKFAIDKLEQVQPMLKNVAELILRGLAAGKVIITLGRESRSDRQNRLFHKLILEISRQVILDRQYDFESWKALLVDGYEQELKANGEKLNKPSRIVISLDGQRAVTIRPSTTDFIVKEANGFIDFLMCFGAEHGVRFSADGEIYKDELRRAA